MSDVKVIAVADDVGYTDEKGNPFYASRGKELTITEDEFKRLGESTPAQIQKGDWPTVVKLDHPEKDWLVAGVKTDVNPDQAYAKMVAAHGAGQAGLVDPAYNAADEASTAKPPMKAAAAIQFDFNSLTKDQLKAVAAAGGLDDSGTKDELVARLNAAQGGAPAETTPRVGASAASDESPSES